VTDILKGSEGVFGVLVELSLKVYRFFPENRKYFGYIFPGWSQAVDAAREICQAQFGLPAVLRISDAAETDNAFQLYPQPAPLEWALTGLGFKPGRRCLCMGTVEGERDFTALVRRKIAAVARRNGGYSITGSPARKWETDRYTNYLFSEAVSDYDIIMDTVETPVLWDNLHHIHDTVLAYARSVPGTTCMSHMSHFYPQGTNLYFIFGVKGSLERYIDYRTGLVDAMVRAGGSPSHHHGVGRLMTPWIGSFLGKPEMDVLRALKGHFDPHGVMNPGSQLGLLPPDDQPV
jgi:alkyldihydroxyacetonephosphate synthase